MLGGAATHAQEASPLVKSSQANDPADLIHLGDLIEIDVIGGFEFDWRGTLDPEGFLKGFDKTPEPVFGRCLSTSELARVVTKAYSRFLRDPKIEVRILDKTDRPLAYLTGAIKIPMKVRIKRTVRLSELIVIAGGFTDRVSGDITIFRPENISCLPSVEKAPTTLKIRISDLLAGQTGADPLVVSGDIINVIEAQPIYVIGGVGNPTRLDLRNEITLTRAIDSAGGVLRSSSDANVTIYRRENGVSRVISADLRKIADGTEEDPPLKPFDIVDVPKKGSEKSRFPPVIEGLDGSAGTGAKVVLRVIE